MHRWLTSISSPLSQVLWISALSIPSLALSLLFGCTSPRGIWNETPPKMLREMVLGDEQIVLEMATIQLGPDAQALLRDIWAGADEQALDLEVRRRLLRNGFRVGILGSQLPEAVSRILNASSGNLTGKGKVSDPQDFSWTHRQLRTSEGQRHQIVTRGNRDDAAYLYSDGERTVGRTLTSAEPQLSLTATRTADGRIRLTLLPEIHHGEPRGKYTAYEGAFRFESGRDVQDFPDLRFSVALRPGEIVLITSLEGNHSLGSVFFRKEESQKLLLIRLAMARDLALFPTSTQRANTETVHR